MVAPTPQEILRRAWIRDFILGGGEFTQALEDQIVAILGTVLTTRGDLLSRGASNVERRATGSANQIPISDGTDWTWATPFLTDEIDGEIRFPEDGTTTIILDSKIARTITEISVKTSAGTVTATPKIGSATLGGGANSATTTKSTVTHSSANAMSVADTLTFVLSSTSADCERLSFTIKFTRTL